VFAPRYPSSGIIKSVNAERHAKLQETLEHIVRTLTREYQPDKIILFGSMASGDVHEWSDLDLVIIKDTARPFVQRGVEAALLCRARVGVDYLVYTPDEFAQMIAQDNIFIVDEVIAKGRVLYEREPAQAVA
jgi:predicted nucleotidyltransferase